MKKISGWAVLMLIFVIVVAVGCSSNSAEQPESNEGLQQETRQGTDLEQVNKDPDPVTIIMGGTQFGDADFNEFVRDPVRAKYPHITVVLQKFGPTELEQSIAQGFSPDIQMNWLGGLAQMIDFGMDESIDTLVRKHNFDMSIIPEYFWESERIATNTDELIGFPIFNNQFALFYNRELFDRFSVPEPVDGMTWEDVQQLAVRMSRTVDGHDYRGMFPDSPIRLIDQMGLPRFDLDAKTSRLTDEGFAHVYQILRDIYSIPGNMPKSMALAENVKGFIAGELAMFTGYTAQLAQLNAAEGLDWDVVTFPQNLLKPGIGYRVDTANAVIPRQSRHKDVAFQVIETLLSDEIQTAMARAGKGPVLNKQEVKNEFGKGIAGLEDKNLQAFIALDLMSAQNASLVSNTALYPILSKALNAVLSGELDINTALRMADEELNQEIKKIHH